MAARQQDDDAQQAAQKATMQAQAAMLTPCGAVWNKQHKKVNNKLKQCETTKLLCEGGIVATQSR